MRRLIVPTLILLLVLGCSGSDQPSSSQQAPMQSAATAMESKLTSGMSSFMPRVPRFEAVLVGIFNPSTPLAQTVTLTPDPNPNAPPFSFTFTGPYDSNGDGFNESRLSGQATFTDDPAVAWSRVTGHATVDTDIPIVGHIYHADITFSITSAERQLSGSGTFTDPLFTGNTTTITVPNVTPLVAKPATGAAGAVSNACGYSLEGQMLIEVTGPSGTLKSTWNFSPNSASVVVNNRTFTDPSGQTTMLPDRTIDTPCGSGGTINDWVGTYDQHWACLPREFGEATITISPGPGADTVTITDEDPPNSGIKSTYTATTIGANPHALHGFFISGPMGFHFREDFYWTMRKSLSGFAEFASYVYTEGPKKDTGGLCVASAPRL